jgi:hypothetical protein
MVRIKTAIICASAGWTAAMLWATLEIAAAMYKLAATASVAGAAAVAAEMAPAMKSRLVAEIQPGVKTMFLGAGAVECEELGLGDGKAKELYGGGWLCGGFWPCLRLARSHAESLAILHCCGMDRSRKSLVVGSSKRVTRLN